MNKMLTVSSSPHIRHIDSTRSIMADVIIALLPSAIFGCLLFGIRAAAILLVTVVSAVIAEFLWNKLLKKTQTIGDLSAVVTGLLLGMNLSSSMPIWMAAIGSVAAIIVVKQMFGGLGHNFVNPAIAARIILLVSFPSAMASFVMPIDAVASPTPLVYLASDSAYSYIPNAKTLFLGLHGGCIGETSALLLLLGGLYLVIRRVISPIIPLSFIGTVAVFSAIFGLNPMLQVLSGGLVLGAVFMATDYTTSPHAPLGKLIFGIGCGAITFVIRYFGVLPEGVSYAIILMNILTPHIEKLTAARPFGFIKPKKESDENEA